MWVPPSGSPSWRVFGFPGAVAVVWAAVPAVLPREVAVVLAWLRWLVMSVLLQVVVAATGLMAAVLVAVWSE